MYNMCSNFIRNNFILSLLYYSLMLPTFFRPRTFCEIVRTFQPLGPFFGSFTFCDLIMTYPLLWPSLDLSRWDYYDLSPFVAFLQLSPFVTFFELLPFVTFFEPLPFVTIFRPATFCCPLWTFTFFKTFFITSTFCDVFWAFTFCNFFQTFNLLCPSLDLPSFVTFHLLELPLLLFSDLSPFVSASYERWKYRNFFPCT